MRSVLAALLALALICLSRAHAGWDGNWGVTIGGDESTVTALDTDDDGYIYVAGNFSGTISIAGGPELTAWGQSVFLAKLSPGGAHIWSALGRGLATDEILGMAIGADGSIVVCGGTSSPYIDFGTVSIDTPGNPDGFAVLYSADGTPQFGTKYGVENRSATAHSVAFTSSTEFTVAGTFWGDFDMYGTSISSNGGKDIFLANHSTGGATAAVTTYGGTGHENYPLIATSPGGTFYLSGIFESSIDIGSISLDPVIGNTFVARFTAPGGPPTWAHAFGGDDAIAQGRALVADVDDNLLVTGYTNGAFPFAGGTLGFAGGSLDGFIVAYKGNGSEGWGDSFGGSGQDAGYSIAIDGNTIYIGGTYQVTADFGPFTQTAVDAQDACVLTLSRFGVWESAIGAGGMNSSQGLAIAAGDWPIVAGWFKDTIEIDPLEIVHPGDGERHGFIASLIDPIVGVTDATPAPPVVLGPATPNPFQAVAHFELAEGFTPRVATVHDIGGRLVRTLAPTFGNSIAWDGRTDHGVRAGAGVYFLRVSDGAEEHRQRVTVAR